MNEQVLRAFNWDGNELTPAFEVDFTKERLGRAHHMKFGSKAMKAAFDEPTERVAAHED
jgi:selenium-binding protein 1